VVLLVGLSALAGCGSWQRQSPPVVASTKPAAPVPRVPGAEPLSRYGNPEFYEVLGKRYVPLKSARGFRERGIASWYGPDFHGELTSTREIYDMYQMSAAHKLLPLPTWVEVRNLENGRKVVVRVNDRGPFKDNRVIDLSYAAALALDVVRPGTAFVEVQALDPLPPQAAASEVRVPVATGRRTRMYLQVGAFSERVNAERLQSRLADALGAAVTRILSEPTEAPRIYKVQLGPITNVEHADQVVAALAGLGITDHRFVNH
jgi:rare lipoprotein A